MIQLQKKLKLALAMLSAGFFAFACAQTPKNSTKMITETPSANQLKKEGSTTIDTVTLGAGCFWCVEAVFQRLKGVQSVKSGYSGGSVKNPSYKEVCNGTTGHAEVCQIVYNTQELSFDDLLEVFWKTHDPTTLNSQGADFGTQYRSAIFYHSEDQKIIAEQYKKKLNEAKVYDHPIVTEITAFTNFYPAEDYHQNYFNSNGSQSYCKFVIQPKLEKFEKVFKEKLKK